jgi:D-sedoheptulose 7-phosphate isomerase
MSFSESYIAESTRVLGAIDPESVERCAAGIAEVRERDGRLFILGVGGSAGHASHAVNVFRKICDVDSYTPVDNVSELTARVNDDGWSSTFSEWLKGSRLSSGDAVLVFRVGGATPNAASLRTSSPRSNSPGKEEAPSSASSAATAGTPPRARTPAS